MKTLGRIGFLVMVLFAATAAAPPAQAGVDVSFGFFYSNLHPHGSWLVSANYGRVWRPAIHAPGWHPYYDGYWVYTDLGWSWVSDYPWGGIAYHYGTWAWDPIYGWVWVPGYVWAPSWVVFRTGPDYIGWAPVPVGYSIGVGVRLTNYRHDHYVFLPSRDFLVRGVRGRALPPARVKTIIHRTTVVNNIRIENNVVVNRGPDVRIIERAHGARIKPRSIERVPKAGPTWRVTRDDLRVASRRPGVRLRAAEPISERDSRRYVTAPERRPDRATDARREEARGRAGNRRDDETRQQARPRRPPDQDDEQRGRSRQDRGEKSKSKRESREKPREDRPRPDRH
jgi:hypothetical protein